MLIASPELSDPNFKKAVILLCQHSGEGSLGFIINRPLEIELGRLLEDTTGLEELVSNQVYMGGPVQVNSGTILFQGEGHEEDAVEIGAGLYMTGSLDKLKNLHQMGDSSRYRFFLGYSGWGGGQLDFEIRRHSWLVSTLEVEHLLATPPEELWDRTMSRMGIDAGHLITPDNCVIN